ncbi:MAG: T9SS type A sorting domain-containing protein [Ignavibacteriae bacterium]|nr:T9SS type A sorting domain-containing protein [Ignavibacteriota bacterium]
MHTIKLLLIMIFIFSSSAAQNERTLCKHVDGNVKLFKAAYPGDDKIDITYYKLDLNITYTPEYLKGEVTVEGKSLQNNLQNFFLDLQNNLTTDSVKTGNQNLAFSHTQNKLEVTLPASISAGESFSVVVYYQGRPGSSGFGSFEFNSHNSQPIIWTLSEPYGASDWFPCKDSPADKADSSDVWVTADDFFVSVSNGTLEEVLTNGDGTKTYKWKNHYPIAHYLISLAMTNYAEYKDYFHYSPTDSMLVIHYIYPEDLTPSTKAKLDRTIDMLEVFTEKYGEYPFIMEKYGHAQFEWGGGMEHQTISSMGGFSEGLVAHELAHQWYGNKITCADWNSIWLNEGFATYSEGVFEEAAYGKAAYDNFIIQEMGNPGQWGRAKSAVGSIYLSDISGTSQIFNGARSYAKAAIVLHMLRGVVGTDTFFDIMKTYASDPQVAYAAAVTEDFQRVAEDVSGVNLNYFFSQWIYGENYPKYSYNWFYNNTGGDNYNVELQLSQQTNTSPTFFTMPIEIKITTAVGDSTYRIFNDAQNQTFNFNVEGEPVELIFDPNNWIMEDIISVTSVDRDNITVADYKLSQNFPNPFNPSTTIEYFLPKGEFVNLTVYDMLGNKIAILVNEQKEAGQQTAGFDFSKLSTPISSGVYIYKIEAGKFSNSKKFMLLK